MWAKFSLGSKRIIVCLLLLALVASSVGAWSLNFGKAKPVEPVVSEVVMVSSAIFEAKPQSPPGTSGGKASEPSLSSYIEALEKQLAEREASLKAFQATSSSTIAALKAELARINELLPISKLESARLASERDTILIERDNFATDLAIAKAQLKPTLGGLVGFSTMIDAGSGNMGMAVHLGVSYWNLQMIASVELMADGLLFEAADFQDLGWESFSYELGVFYRF